MLASGNANENVCVNNLLRIVRGEVPYDRLRGLDGRNIDRPASEAEAAIIDDARWALGIYEPRVEAESVDVTVNNGAEGGFDVTATLG